MPTFRFKHLRQQWPVGHGFFHTALVQLDRETYRYVYDCGAETFETINSQINRYASNEAMEGRGNSIDMLVVSHFHNDHIKGLPHFLSLFNVKKLVIPYLEEDDKLVALAGLAAHGAETWTLLSGLLIEPREWLRTRSPDAELIEITNNPIDDNPDVNDQIPPASGTGLSLGIGSISHHKRVSIFSQKKAVWTFKFYVQECWEIYTLVLSGIIDKFSPSSQSELMSWLSDAAWIQANHTALKDVFKDIGSGKQNATTLCMYSGIERDQLDWMERDFSSSNHGPFYCRHWHWSRFGWLGTGDAELKSTNNMAAFERHYSDYLDEVDTVTIPHHGSIDNYNSKLSDIGYRHVITADAAVDPKGHHPSANVLLNLNINSAYTHIATLDDSSTLFDRFRGFGEI
jgi:hypothetical protein